MLDKLGEENKIKTNTQVFDETDKPENNGGVRVVSNITDNCFQAITYSEEKHNNESEDSYRTSMDKITIPDSQDFLNNTQDYVIDSKEKRVKVTDYAIMCGANSISLDGINYGNLWLKSKGDENSNVYTADRHFKKVDVTSKSNGVLPVTKVKIEEILKEGNNIDFYPLYDIHVKSKDQFIKMGYAPNSFVGIKKQDELNKLFDMSMLKFTGKQYFGYIDDNGNVINSEEYQDLSNGKKYARVLSKVPLVNLIENDLEKPEKLEGLDLVKNDKFLWAEVQPISWKVVNYKNLPSLVTGKGKGRSKYMQLVSDSILYSGLPLSDDENKNFWQESLIRTFLNGKVESSKSPSMLEKDLVDNNFVDSLQASSSVDNIYVNVSSDVNKNDNEITNASILNGFDSLAGNTYSTTNVSGGLKNALEKITKLMSPKIPSKKEFQEKQEKVEEKPMLVKKEPKLEEKVKKMSRIQKILEEANLRESYIKLTDTEKIYSWIANGESICLRGPRGIGKTERFSKFKNLVYLKLSNNMFPEIVNGSVNLETGETIPPEYLKQAYLMLATEEEKQEILNDVRNLYKYKDAIMERSKTEQAKQNPIILLLDELLNVKPTTQSLVYNLVLNKRVEVARGLYLPENVVVVATGNQKKYSSVASDLAEPLEKRFDHILDMEPKVGEWLEEYAIPNKLHPLVVSYIYYNYEKNRRSEEIGDIGYFYEEPEVGEKFVDKFGNNGKTNDPRGWTAISRMLYNFEEAVKKGVFAGKDVDDLLWTTLMSKLRREWASDFYNFYNTLTISLEDVAQNKYSKSAVPSSISEKFAQIGTLITANESQLKPVRKFIKSYCGSEYVALFDIYWAGKDEDRIDIISALQEQDQQNLEKEMQKINQDTENRVNKEQIAKGFMYSLDEFWCKALCGKKIAVQVTTAEQDMLLRRAFTGSGKTWDDGASFLNKSNFTNIGNIQGIGQGIYRNDCYFVNPMHLNIKTMFDCEFIEFNNLNIEKYLEPTDIKLWWQLINIESSKAKSNDISSIEFLKSDDKTIEK